MFTIRSFLGRGRSDAPNNSAEVAQIQDCQLYLLRDDSVKGARECIYNVAVATIRKSDTEFAYQLVITRAFAEGEAELLDEEDESDEERSFLLDEYLELYPSTYESNPSFVWRDVDDEDTQAQFELVIDSTRTGRAAIEAFYSAMLRAMYERKTHMPAEKLSIPQLENALHIAKQASTSTASSQSANLLSSGNAQPQPYPEGPTLVSEQAQLFLWNPKKGCFEPAFRDLVEASVVQSGQFRFWLVAKTDRMNVLAHQLNPDMNSRGAQQLLSFTWNYPAPDGSVNAWCLRFGGADPYTRFTAVLGQCNYEMLNGAEWSKAKVAEQEYILKAYEEDVDMRDAEADEAEVEKELDEDESNSDEEDQNDNRTCWETHKKNKNSALAVGYKGINVVVRGDQIGVFRETEDGKLQLGGTVSDIKTPGSKGTQFEPSKVMLHDQDRSLVLMNPSNHHSLFQMDLETGKMISEWKLHDDITLNQVTPVDKFAQMTPEQTLLGTSHNALFRIDPRLSGDKLVTGDMKQYATKNKFSSIVTTETGKIAVGSEKGDIRLFDKLGKIAKTTLPALGDPIRGIDVTKDGRYMVATTKTYLLLIDTQIGIGPNTGKSGFDKSFPADSKPIPRRLQLRPEHVAYMDSSVNFSPARFNTGPNSQETTIVTSSGPFVIAWNFNQVKKGRADKYEIKKYSSSVVEDNFSFGNDKDIIVALHDDVLMVPKRALKKPTRSSLATPTQNLPSHSNIVNAPY